MLRSPKSNLVITTVLLITTFLLWFHPVFDRPANRSPKQILEKDPLPMKPLPKAMRLVLEQQVIDMIRDRWGYTWPLSGELEGDSMEVRKLNQGISQALDGKTTAGLNALRSRWNVYPQRVTNKRYRESDILPSDRDTLISYGLYRYNRSVLLLEMAGSWRSGDNKINRDLKQALYDLRRSVGAFETLGKKDYWGGLNAWEGGALDPEHTGLPIHTAYANLATAYLRLGGVRGYPGVDKSYMLREANKYSDENSDLSAVVSMLIQSCLDQRGSLNLKKYRLTMALQNLEAGSRGLSRGEEARLNYMTGIILSHLRKADQGVSADDALEFLKLAAHVGADKDARAAYAARKELALIYLEIENDDKFLETILAINPAAIEDGLGGPHRSWGLLFTDLAQVSTLAGGDLDRFFNHLQAREDAFTEGKVDEQTRAAHNKIIAALAEVFFRDLADRLRRMDEQGQSARAGLLLAQLETTLNKHDREVMTDAYHTWCRNHLPETLSLSISLNNNPQSYKLLAFIPWLLLLILFLYWYWVIASHRNTAKRLFQSGYEQDLQGS